MEANRNLTLTGLAKQVPDDRRAESAALERRVDRDPSSAAAGRSQ